GARLRQRAHRARAPALGRGQPQLRGLRDRRHPLLPRGARSEDRRPPPERGRLPDEAPPAPADRRSRQGAGRGLLARGGRALGALEVSPACRPGTAAAATLVIAITVWLALRGVARISVAGAPPGPPAPPAGRRARRWSRRPAAPPHAPAAGAGVHAAAPPLAHAGRPGLAGAAGWGAGLLC